MTGLGCLASVRHEPRQLYRFAGKNAFADSPFFMLGIAYSGIP
jgi:hypothetical protein